MHEKIITFKQFVLILTLLFSANPILAQIDSINSTKKLTIGIAGSKPFVFLESQQGIAIEIWEEIAEKKSLEYEYQAYNTVDEALSALKDKKVDIVVGPISITAKRAESMQFSQPFYNSSISILSRIENQSFWQKIKPLFSLKLLMAVGFFLIILAIVGTLIWLAERKNSPEQFSTDPLKGIGTGMWLAIVTMSTTGYGDKAPVSLMGRIITGIWMVVSIIFATTMVAGIASTLTLSSIETTTISNIVQLSGRKVATISRSSSEDFLIKTKAKVVITNKLEDAITKLENKEVDAVIFDRPQILFYLKDNKQDHLYISKAAYFKQGYGFAFLENSQLILDVNRTLLELAESQEIERIIHTYIKKDE